jgi:AraC-like DNA-binding protein
MRYTVLPPAPPLRPYVECLWRLEGDGAGLPEETIVPDGCMEIVLHCGDRFARVAAGGAATASQPRAFVVGQMLGPLVIRPGARVETWGVRFRPGGAAPFFDEPMPDLAGRCVDLEAIGGAGRGRWIDRTREARTAPERRRRIEAWLLERLGRRHTDPLPGLAAGAIVSARGRVRIDDLASRAGLGPRQFERRFLKGVGLPPRALARVVRFQNLFRLVHARDGADGGWADLACAAGYYDQAHLLRDFRELAGSTPPRFLAGQGEFSRALTGRARLDDLFG